MIASDIEVNYVCYIMIFCLKNELICQVQVVKKNCLFFNGSHYNIFTFLSVDSVINCVMQKKSIKNLFQLKMSY